MPIKNANQLGCSLCIALIFLLSACQKPFAVQSHLAEENESSNIGNSPIGRPGDPGAVEVPLDFNFCSRLDFKNLLWPANLQEQQRNSFALALNVTGSFEGNLTWSTLGNNSDGMGMSLGLLQQNLGSGTLQPLLIEMKTLHRSEFVNAFSTPHFQSIVDMLNTWQSSVGATSSESSESIKEKYLFVPDEYSISELDEDHSLSQGDFTLNALSKNQSSVNWAIKTVYTGSQFKSDWKMELSSLSSLAGYRQLQLKEALKYHERTLDYLVGFDFDQLRFYLLMYDFVIQNGGFKNSHWELYQEYRKKNPQATDEQRALKLIEIRLASVRPEFKEDVRSRKMTLLNGQGVVHGQSRKLSQEYCYQPNYVIR